MKKYLSMALMVTLLLALLAVPVKAEPEVEEYPVWVEGVQVTSDNKDNIPVSGGHASFDPEEKTLTLFNAIILDGLVGTHYYGIFIDYPDPTEFTIKLKQRNRIYMQNYQEGINVVYGIESAGKEKVKIIGEGSSSSLTIEDRNDTNPLSAIHFVQDMTIENCIIDIRAWKTNSIPEGIISSDAGITIRDSGIYISLDSGNKGGRGIWAISVSFEGTVEIRIDIVGAKPATPCLPLYMWSMGSNQFTLNKSAKLEYLDDTGDEREITLAPGTVSINDETTIPDFNYRKCEHFHLKTIDTNTVTVTFDLNLPSDAEGDPLPSDTDYQPQTVVAGQPLPAIADPVLDNYDFKGWVYLDNGKPTIWNISDPVNSDLHLTAKWTKKSETTEADNHNVQAPSEPIEVADPNHLTDAEKDAIKAALDDTNNWPDGSSFIVQDDGTVVVTYGDGSQNILQPSQIIKTETVIPQEPEENPGFIWKDTAGNQYVELSDVHVGGKELNETLAAELGGVELVVEPKNLNILDGRIINDYFLYGRKNLLFDIYLRVIKTGEILEDVTATVTVTDPEIHNSFVEGYILDPVGNSNYELRKLNVTIDGDQVTFFGDHFSYYVLSMGPTREKQVAMPYFAYRAPSRQLEVKPEPEKQPEVKVDAVKAEEPVVVQIPATGEVSYAPQIAVGLLLAAMTLLVLKKKH